MGSFDGSCAITGTAIQAGEPVLQVVKFDSMYGYSQAHREAVNRAFGRTEAPHVTSTTYELLCARGEARRYATEPYGQTYRELAFFQKYKRVEQPGEVLTITPLDLLWSHSQILVRWGVYDDYGWVVDPGDHPHPDKYGSYIQFMVHRPAAEAIALDQKHDPGDLWQVFTDVVDLAYLCRIHVWHTDPVGEQSFSAEEYQAHRLRLSLIDGQLKARMDEWRREGFNLPEGVEP